MYTHTCLQASTECWFLAVRIVDATTVEESDLRIRPQKSRRPNEHSVDDSIVKEESRLPQLVETCSSPTCTPLVVTSIG